MPYLTNVALTILVALGMSTTCAVGGKATKEMLVDNKYELVQLNILNRHGHRAPNGPYWKICPNDAYNRKYYKGVGNEGLTDQGFQEEFEMGQYLHDKYGWFIGSKYNSKHHFVRAVAEPRTIQSALVAAQAIFPDGFGPKGLVPARPQYAPVFTDLESHEYLLDDLQCIPEIQSAVAKYLAGDGAKVIKDKENVEALKELFALCGTDPAIFSKKRQDIGIKVMIDGVIFNHDMGLNVLNGRVKPKLFNTLRNFTNTLLQGKLYGTDEQRTFSAANYPFDMIRRFTLATKTPEQKSNSGLVLGYENYVQFTFNCAHREELYGVAHFFDFPIHVPNYPPMELPTGSSFIFALLRTGDSNSTYKYFVKTDLWTPRDGIYTLAPRTGCDSPHLCTFEEFTKVYNDRVTRTGTWEKLCKVEIPPLDKIF